MQRTHREAGFSMIEMAVALALVAVILGAAGMAFSTASHATTEVERRLLAQAENDRALLAMLLDLRTTNTLETDASDRPYFTIENHGSGRANAIAFRRTEGLNINVNLDLVTTLYGETIRYFVDDANNLIREKGGERRVVANRVAETEFALSIEGTIHIRVRTFTGRGRERIEVESWSSVTPLNGRPG